MEKKYSVYIHIPFCISKCRYCDFFSVPCSDRKTLVPDEYINALCNEMTRLSGITVDTVYVGGGTPSLLKPYQIQKLFDSLCRVCHLDDNAEITFEVNPDDVSKEFIEALKAAGVNRISCGIQSMNDKALGFAGRRADSTANKKALELFKQYWNKALSLDFICGLPEETEESFISGLSEAVSYSPSHISMYSLTIEKETPFGCDLEAGKYQYDYDFADKLWLKGRDFLEKHNYMQYEVSNFALGGAGSACRHNLAYWSHKDYFGLGSGATGTIYTEGGEGLRQTNTSDINEYINWWLSSDSRWLSSRPQTGVSKPPILKPSVSNPQFPQLSEKIDVSTSEFEFFMMGLRKLEGISQTEYEKIFNSPLPPEFIELFNKWKKKGLCHKINERYALNQEGILFLNSFLEGLL